jgi:hydrogenase-4 component E
MTITLPEILLAIIFLTIVFLHIAKKNMAVVVAYGIQSSAIVAILFESFVQTGNLSLLFLVLLVFVVKVVLAPIFFVKLIKKHELAFSVSMYLNMPLTLIVLAGLTAVANSNKFAPLTNIIPANQTLLSLALSAMLLSLFLIINRKGALSQIVGILSLENSIVAFAVFAGLEQSLGLQVGIIFNISIWLVIATVFMSMIYRHFGTLDVTSMTDLKD